MTRTKPKPKPKPKAKAPQSSAPSATPESPAPAPKPKPATVQDDQERRIAACSEAIRSALAQFRCEIVAQIGEVEPQGNTGSKVVISATWALGAHP